MKTHPSLSSHRLLIIDDNPTIHEDIHKILCPPGEDPAIGAMAAKLFGQDSKRASCAQFRLASAFQGQEGLGKVEEAIAEGDPYELAFVDVRMPPGWDGVETIKRVWARDPALQIVICTAYSDHSWEHIVAQLGHSDSLVILKKPFDNVEVLQLAHALTRKWTLNRRTEAEGRSTRPISPPVPELPFRQVFFAARVPMLILNRNYVCLEANEYFLKLTNTQRSEVVGRSLLALDIYEEPEEARRAVETFAADGSSLPHRCSLRGVERPNEVRLSFQHLEGDITGRILGMLSGNQQIDC